MSKMEQSEFVPGEKVKATRTAVAIRRLFLQNRGLILDARFGRGGRSASPTLLFHRRPSGRAEVPAVGAEQLGSARSDDGSELTVPGGQGRGHHFEGSRSGASSGSVRDLFELPLACLACLATVSALRPEVFLFFVRRRRR